MNKYEVGQVIEKFRYHQEGVQFDISDEGATMLVFFANPKQSEIDQFSAGKRFEIRFVELYGVVMVTTKIGNLNWMDAPYTPHLSPELTKFQFPNENQGLGLTLVLVDAVTGEIKSMRLMGLSQNFTKQLFGIVMEQKIADFDKSDYYKRINTIYSRYSTEQIVKMSKYYCKINS